MHVIGLATLESISRGPNPIANVSTRMPTSLCHQEMPQFMDKKMTAKTDQDEQDEPRVL
jgi:hypothetical protein